MNATTAILLFSRSATAETAVKGFGNRRIAAALIQRTEQTLSRTGLPVFRIDEQVQRGLTFGQRLANAASDAFAGGYERLIVVGNDCPHLRTSHLRAAARMLEKGESVIGPDGRGGVWLIGLQRGRFNHASFERLAWQTDELLPEICLELPDARQLEMLSDINGLEDLRRQWSGLAALLPEIYDLIIGVAENDLLVVSNHGVEDVRPANGRAPPVAFAA